MASIYKRGKTWWISYHVGQRRVQRSLKTQSAREAEEIKKQYTAAERIDLLPEPSDTAIGPFLQKLCEYWRRVRKGKGAASDIGRLRQFFGPVCPALEYPPRTERRLRDNPRPLPSRRDEKAETYIPIKKLEDLTANMITAVLRERFVTGEISGRTANRYRGVLSSMFTFARKHHGYVCPEARYRNPVEGVDRFPEKAGIITYLNDEQIEQQLKALEPYPQIRAMAAVAIFAGPRREAITWLTNADVNLDGQLLHVRAKKVEGEYWEPKTGRDRSVPIGTRLKEVLSEYGPPQGSAWFFPSPRGGRWHPDSFSARLREINEALGLPWSCTDFRHTFGSHLAQAGTSLYKISSLMGNSPGICRKHYAALLPAEMRDEVENAFSKKSANDPGQDLTPELLRELLQKIDRLGQPAASEDPPRFRIVE